MGVEIFDLLTQKIILKVYTCKCKNRSVRSTLLKAICFQNFQH